LTSIGLHVDMTAHFCSLLYIYYRLRFVIAANMLYKYGKKLA